MVRSPDAEPKTEVLSFKTARIAGSEVVVCKVTLHASNVKLDVHAASCRIHRHRRKTTIVINDGEMVIVIRPP